jgi:hypothetical protein
MSTPIAKALAFCAHLATAVRDGTKTVTYKPLSPNDLARRAAGWKGEATPYPVGAKTQIYEPCGHAATGKVFESSFTPKDARAERNAPASFRPITRLESELTATIVACELVKLSTLTESDARKSVVAPAGSTALSEFERQWRATYRGPQAWEMDPLCWRIAFTVNQE